MLIREMACSRSLPGCFFSGLSKFLFSPAFTVILAVLAFLPSALVTVQAAAPVHKIDGGFVREWLVLGPFPSQNMETDFLASGGGEANARPKEGDVVTTTDGRTLSWTRIRSENDFVSLDSIVNVQGWSAAYVYCELESDEALDTNLRVSALDQPAVWINGTKLAQFPGYTIGRRIDVPPVAPMRLNQGRNALLMKLKQGPGEWLFLTQPLPRNQGTAEIVVTDSTGKIATNAVAQFYDQGKLVAQITADPAGKADACLYPLAKAYDLRVTSGDQGAWMFDFALNPGERKRVNVTLADTGSLTGRVLAMDASPQSGIVVQALRESAAERPPRQQSLEGANILRLLPVPDFSETALTDDSGRYRFVNLRPGSYRIRAHTADGFADPKGTNRVVASAATSLAVGPAAGIQEVNFVLPEVKKGTWTHFPTMHGLTPTRARCLLQTADGALWVGTADQTIHVLDGVENKVYGNPDIPGVDVHALRSAADGSIWIGTSAGTLRFGEGRFELLPFNELLPRRAGLSLETEPWGTVWIGTATGLWKHDGRAVESFTVTNGLPSNTIKALLKTRDGALWVGTANGLARYDGRKFETMALFQGFNSRGIGQKFHQSKDGALWFCGDAVSSHGVIRYDGKSFYHLGAEDGLASNNVKDIVETSDGILWFAMRGGIARFDGKTIVNYGEPDGLGQIDVHDLLVAADDVIWCATQGGVFRFDPGNIVSVTKRDGLVEKFGATPGVFTIQAGPDGWHYFGTGWGGAYRIKGKVVESVPAVSPEAVTNYVRKIHRAADGALWFGANNGIFRLGEKGLIRVLTEPWTLALGSDREGNLWSGHGWNGGGVSHHNLKTGERTLFTKANGLPGDNVWSVADDLEGGVWIGSEGGMARYRNGKMQAAKAGPGIETSTVWDFHRDIEGSLWASSSSGLHQLSGGKQRSITKTNGLPDQSIWTSTPGRGGIIWMGTETHGLAGYDGKAVTIIDKRDGLPGNQPFSLAVDADGSLLIGFLDGGLARYRPSKRPPSIRLTEARLDDQAFAPGTDFPGVKTGNRISIRYQETDLKTHPDKRQFRQQVKDSSGNVVLAAVTKERRFEWTPQKRGAYTFEVQAIDRDLNYSAPAHLALTVSLPWYANAWILAPGGVTFGGLAIWAFVSGALYMRKNREAVRLREQMLAQERQARETLEQSNHSLARAKETADAARIEADVANRAKSTFLANMSHEIRTPLNAIFGYAQILRRKPGLALDDRAAVKIIESSSDHLLTLINHVLDLSKIEAGAMALSRSDFDLAAMVQGLSALFEPRCREKGLRFEVEWAAGAEGSSPNPVHGDEVKLRQILINLLGNAVKFTDQGEVRLRVKSAVPDASGVRAWTFEIIDSGPGILADFQEKVFAPFVQAGEGEQKGGTGLGLAISKRLAQLMEGTIGVDSAPSQGSRFYVTVPLGKAEVPVGPLITEQAKEPRRLAKGSSVNALIVDDVEQNRQVLFQLLTSLGCRIRVAESGARALEQIRLEQPDIVLTDIRMPGMTGFELKDKIIEEFGPGRIKLVAISASVLAHEQKYCLESGFDDFVGKPFRLSRIGEVLVRLLHVEFEYIAGPDSATPSEPGDATPHPRIPLPDALLKRLREAAKSYRVQEFKRCLAEVEQLAPEGARLAAILSELNQKGEMDKILEILDTLA